MTYDDSMTKPDTNRLIEFHDLLMSFQQIERRTMNPRDSSRYENDVEHSYYLAMAAWMLAPHFSLDKDACIRIALTHDLVEVYAGDTFAFGDQAELDTKDSREQEALERLEREWPDFQDMIDAMGAYKHKASEEAKFVYALDKLMPVIVNILGNGGAWKENKITIDHLIKEKERKIPKDSPIYEYYKELLTILRDAPHYFYQGEK